MSFATDRTHDSARSVHRLSRKHSCSEERLYAVGIALRAVASTNSAGKPTWIFQCDMGESKLHETDIMYISNDAIT